MVLAAQNAYRIRNNSVRNVSQGGSPLKRQSQFRLQSADAAVRENYMLNERRTEMELSSGRAARAADFPSCVHIPPGRGAVYERNMLEYSK